MFWEVGHGGLDPGAVANGMRESDVNLIVALSAAETLNPYNIEVALSRTTDENDPLTEAIAEANAFRPDLAIGGHFNAGGGDGFEVYRQTNRFASRSLKLAKAIEERVKEIGQNSRGVKTSTNASGTDYYGWLRQVNCPAVLCEGAFIDNKADVQIISSIEKQRAFGVAYARGILDYLGIAWRPDKAPTVGYSVQEGFYTKIENAKSAMEQAKKEGRSVILVEAERVL
jgi:N-acetylmuramoyl-L-alanine amidase